MKARDLHRDAFVFDAHTDVPTRLYVGPADLSERLPDGHVDLPRLREGGVDALIFALFIPAPLGPEAGLQHARELFAKLREQLRPGELELAVSVEDIRRAKRHGAVAAVTGLENGRPLTVPGALEECAGMGVRVVTLTHQATHEWCDACTDEPRHGGLSEEGVGIVREMARFAMLPDISHVSDVAALQCLEVAKGPVVASHSSARAICNHPRNLPDELIREVARRGGLVMANAYAAFLDDQAARVNGERMKKIWPLAAEVKTWDRDGLLQFAAARQEVLEDNPLPPVPLTVYVDHLIHVIEVAGEEHVGIGTDFDGIDTPPLGLEDVSQMPNLTEVLLDRGVDEAGVRLILGENFLRVLGEAERVAG